LAEKRSNQEWGKERVRVEKRIGPGLSRILMTYMKILREAELGGEDGKAQE